MGSKLTNREKDVALLVGAAHFVGPVFYSTEVQKYGSYLIKRIHQCLLNTYGHELPCPSDKNFSRGEIVVDEQLISWKVIRVQDVRAYKGNLTMLLIAFTRELTAEYKG